MSVIDFTPIATLGALVLPKRYDLELYVGDDVEFVFNLKQADGTTALDVSGASPTCEVKTLADGTESSALTPAVAPDMTDAVNGKIVIPFTPAHTQAYVTAAAPTYVDALIWELQLELDGKVRTYLGGKITLHEDIVETVVA